MRACLKIIFITVLSITSVGITTNTLLAGESTAPEKSKDDNEYLQRNDVVEFLESDQFILSRISLRHLSDDVVGDLLEIPEQTALDVQTRKRALECLALYANDSRVRSKTRELFHKTGFDHQLYQTVVHAFAETHREDAVEDVGKLLESQSAQTREIAVVALGRFGGQTGFERLQKHKAIESNPAVLQRLKTYLP